MQITIGQYFPGRSVLHRMDPRAKILLTIAMIAAVFAAGTWLGYVMLFAFAFAAIRISGVGMKFVLREGREVALLVHGDGFLYNMVRILAGTLMQVGSGKLERGAIARAIETGDRLQLGITAPPQGLTLMRVFYESDASQAGDEFERLTSDWKGLQ